MIDQLVRILVDAGATRSSAARAAVILDRGGSVLAVEFDPELLVFEALLERELTAR